MNPKAREVIKKMILETKEQKLIWTKLSCSRTYNINFHTKINNLPVILFVRRAHDFFSIDYMNLFIPGKATITSSYNELMPLFSEINNQKRPISAELSKWMEEFINQ